MVSSIAAVGALVFSARDARADPGEIFFDFPVRPPPPSKTTPAPPAPKPPSSPSNVPDAALDRTSRAPVPSGVVRIHLRTFKDKGTARAHVHRADGSYALLCASPCTADVPPKSELRITLDDNEDAPHTVVVLASGGSDMDLEVRPAAAGPLAGSIVMMAAGGACVLAGLWFVALGNLGSSSTGVGRIFEPSKTYGYVTIGIGAALAVGGLVWLSARSHEPQVKDSPPRGPEIYGRRDTLLGDVAVAKPRDASRLAPTPPVPLEYSIAF